MGEKAYCGLHDPATGKSWIGTFAMTKEELADHEKYGDLYFGGQKDSRRKIETAVDLFDFHFDSYRHTSKEKLLEFMDNHPGRNSLEGLSQKELAEIYSERMTNAAIAQGFAIVQPPARGRGMAKQK